MVWHGKHTHGTGQSLSGGLSEGLEVKSPNTMQCCGRATGEDPRIPRAKIALPTGYAYRQPRGSPAGEGATGKGLISTLKVAYKEQGTFIDMGRVIVSLFRRPPGSSHPATMARPWLSLYTRI